jgi:hypothetical protein
MDARQLILFERSLVAEIAKLEGVLPVSPALASAGDEDAACPEQRISCLALLAKSVGADEIVAARATVLEGSRLLNLKRLHIPSAEITGSFTRQLTDSGGEALLLILGDAVEELFPGQALRSSQRRGVPDAVIRRWDPRPLEPWMFWSGVVATGTAFVTGITFALLSANAENEFKELAHSAEPVAGSQLTRLADKAEDRTLVANLMFALSGALAISSVLVWFFADWGNDERALLLLSPAAGGALLTVGF